MKYYHIKLKPKKIDKNFNVYLKNKIQYYLNFKKVQSELSPHRVILYEGVFYVPFVDSQKIDYTKLTEGLEGIIKKTLTKIKFDIEKVSEEEIKPILTKFYES